MNIVSGRLSGKKVNVDEAFEISQEQLDVFRSKLTECFYEKETNGVVTMALI